jgi:hypothetical protein
MWGMWADGTLDGLKQIAKEEGWHDKETADDKEADTYARNGDQDSHESSGQVKPVKVYYPRDNGQPPKELTAKDHDELESLLRLGWKLEPNGE